VGAAVSVLSVWFQIAAAALIVLAGGVRAAPLDAPGGVHEGLAACAGSACHGRAVAGGPDIRHDEIRIWQDETRPAGAHARAWRVLTEPRAEAIANRLGLGRAETAAACLGCHAEPAAVRGPLFQTTDGVGCEACHGASSGWLANHYAVGVRHADNVAAGMVALESARVRAGVCLDCHFGSIREGQFVTHEIMSAGHPRLAFELDLFSALQKHYDLGPDYAARKVIPGGVKLWAVGQALALDRSLSLFADDRRGQRGAFPEFYFFDCQSCHRTISDDPRPRLTAAPNPGRPIPSGAPPYDDENMIMLSAAAKIAAPTLAGPFEADVRAFHLALAGADRAGAVLAAGRLAGSARALASAFEHRTFDRSETLAMLEQVVADAQVARYTDYEGAAQSVMAIDTLLNAMAAAGQADGALIKTLRPRIALAYEAVNDPLAFRPEAFQTTVGRIALALRTLR
jgi:hypothetical protein